MADRGCRKKDVRGAVKEGADGGPNSGDAVPSGLPAPAAAALKAEPANRVHTAEEKLACSIEALRNGVDLDRAVVAGLTRPAATRAVASLSAPSP